VAVATSGSGADGSDITSGTEEMSAGVDSGVGAASTVVVVGDEATGFCFFSLGFLVFFSAKGKGFSAETCTIGAAIVFGTPAVFVFVFVGTGAVVVSFSSESDSEDEEDEDVESSETSMLSS